MIELKQFVRRWPVLLAGTAFATAAGTYAGVAAKDSSAPASIVGAVSAAIPASFADLAQQVRPAVVFISTEAVGLHPRNISRFPPRISPFSGEHFGKRRVSGVGSGFIIDSSGLVVTNHHVIKGAQSVFVTLNDQSKHEAEVVGVDPKTDLALLRVDVGRALPTVSFGDSNLTRVGDWVVAVGNPFGLGGSVSAGVVSARGRDIQSGPYDDYLQFDASINRGNSGGPLFNVRGEVIGVNTAIYSPSGGNVGIGFAVPAAVAVPVVSALESDGQVNRGWIGLRVQQVTPELAESLNLESVHGALVSAVEEGSPADRAGIKRGDVILSINGQEIMKMRQLVRIIGSRPPRTSVELGLFRGTDHLTVKAELGSLAPVSGASFDREDEPVRGRLGVQLSKLDPRSREMWNIDPTSKGVLVVGVADDSPAARSRLRAGDVILSVNRRLVKNPADVVANVNGHKTDRPLLLLVARDGFERYLAVKLS